MHRCIHLHTISISYALLLLFGGAPVDIDQPSLGIESVLAEHAGLTSDARHELHDIIRGAVQVLVDHLHDVADLRCCHFEREDNGQDISFASRGILDCRRCVIHWNNTSCKFIFARDKNTRTYSYAHLPPACWTFCHCSALTFFFSFCPSTMRRLPPSSSFVISLARRPPSVHSLISLPFFSTAPAATISSSANGSIPRGSWLLPSLDCNFQMETACDACGGETGLNAQE